ncbi:hypothetical protein Nepgr_003916 [Nepenthes gracilis]|uniref:Uncharacterized protein n=1 Tax=Nepenthes gracilis TaxID=150966 RepID=A0AAD3S0L5_NEPGR|nr:hypothetical protein Nepgr_003916 [Nepenthes gracilis]
MEISVLVWPHCSVLVWFSSPISDMFYEVLDLLLVLRKRLGPGCPLCDHVQIIMLVPFLMLLKTVMLLWHADEVISCHLWGLSAFTRKHLVLMLGRPSWLCGANTALRACFCLDSKQDAAFGYLLVLLNYLWSGLCDVASSRHLS